MKTAKRKRKERRLRILERNAMKRRAHETAVAAEARSERRMAHRKNLVTKLDEAIRAIEASGAVGARMTGSGSAVFGVYAHAGACKRAAQELAAAYPTCRMMRTAECGVVIERQA